LKEGGKPSSIRFVVRRPQRYRRGRIPGLDPLCDAPRCLAVKGERVPAFDNFSIIFRDHFANSGRELLETTIRESNTFPAIARSRHRLRQSIKKPRNQFAVRIVIAAPVPEMIDRQQRTSRVYLQDNEQAFDGWDIDGVFAAQAPAELGLRMSRSTR
jgi:hypothetical protein